MRNQIKELKNKDNQGDNEQFIIEISLILNESQKKLTISLFINPPLSVLELKEFISKDFDFPIQDMILFYPLKGIIDNKYLFPFESNKKISLNLILDDKKNDTNKKKNEIILNNNLLKYSKTFNFNKNILNNKNNYSINFFKKDTKNNNIRIENPSEKIINSNINKEFYSINNYNHNENKNSNVLNLNIQKLNKNEINNEINNNNSNLQMKNSKCNFILTKIENKEKKSNEYFLGKKRRISTTFKTTILNKENEETKIKTQMSNNFKIINFNINKNMPTENKETQTQNSI